MMMGLGKRFGTVQGGENVSPKKYQEELAVAFAFAVAVAVAVAVVEVNSDMYVERGTVRRRSE